MVVARHGDMGLPLMAYPHVIDRPAPRGGIASDITPEMVRLLHAGAEHGHGLICLPYQIRANSGSLEGLRRRGFLRWLDCTRPWITDEGRAAVGEASEGGMVARRVAAATVAIASLRAQSNRTVPEDPRSAQDYNIAKTMRMFCALVVKLAEPAPDARGLKCSMNGDPAKFFYLPIKQMMQQPESRDSFVLTLVPKWLTQPDKTGRPRHPQLANSNSDLADGVEWTDEQRASWKFLQRKRDSINVRIRTGGRVTPAKRQYGDTA